MLSHSDCPPQECSDHACRTLRDRCQSRAATVPARRYGIPEQIVYKWKKRSAFTDRSHIAHRLQTQLTPAQEAVVGPLRRTLLLPLIDLLAVTREFLCPEVSRPGLDRCLRRHGVVLTTGEATWLPQPLVRHLTQSPLAPRAVR